MRVLLTIVMMVGLGACATTAPQDGSEPDLTSVKQLKPGQCGLYGWSADAKREFVFFADENMARYDGAEGPVDLVPQGEFPATEYLDPAGETVTLRFGEGELMDGGMRYPRAVIVTFSPENWERIEPVGFLRTCQPK